MAYDEELADRLREAYAGRLPPQQMSERKMFGGICFMVGGHMSCGVVDSTLMARVGPDGYAEALQQPHAREMDFTGRPLRGMVYVDPQGLAEEQPLEAWVERSLAFVSSLPPKPGA